MRAPRKRYCSAPFDRDVLQTHFRINAQRQIKELEATIKEKEEDVARIKEEQRERERTWKEKGAEKALEVEI